MRLFVPKCPYSCTKMTQTDKKRLGMGLNLDKGNGNINLDVVETTQVWGMLLSLSYGFILLILNYEESKLD
jgi:hypothetical protein